MSVSNPRELPGPVLPDQAALDELVALVQLAGRRLGLSPAAIETLTCLAGRVEPPDWTTPGRSPVAVCSAREIAWRRNLRPKTACRAVAELLEKGWAAPWPAGGLNLAPLAAQYRSLEVALQAQEREIRQWMDGLARFRVCAARLRILVRRNSDLADTATVACAIRVLGSMPHAAGGPVRPRRTGTVPRVLRDGANSGPQRRARRGRILMPAIRRGMRDALRTAAEAPVRRSVGLAVPVALDQIRQRDRLRNLDDSAIEQLMESIKARDLHTPIIVRPFALVDPAAADQWGPETSGLYMLVAGAHRLEACRRLGRSHIPAFVRELSPQAARLVEIDENLVRADLTALDRAAFLAARKEIYEQQHPEARRGGDRRAGPTTPSFASASAQTTGWAPRTIQRAVSIHEGLAPAVRAKIAGTPIANSEGILHRLSRLTHAQQSAQVETLLGRATDRPRRRRDGAERLTAAWSDATPDERRRFLDGHELQFTNMLNRIEK